MILDRIFGVIAATGFVFGAIAHVEFIARLQSDPDVFDPPLAVFGICSLTAFVYIVAYAGWRDRLPYDNGELDLLAVVAELPKWAKVVSGILAVYVAGVVCVSLSGIGGEIVPATFRANSVFVSISTVFTALSFVIAAYCLVRMTPPPPFG